MLADGALRMVRPARWPPQVSTTSPESGEDLDRERIVSGFERLDPLFSHSSIDIGDPWPALNPERLPLNKGPEVLDRSLGITKESSNKAPVVTPAPVIGLAFYSAIARAQHH